MSTDLAQFPPPAAIRRAASGLQRRRLARPAFVLRLAAVVPGFVSRGSVAMVAVGAVGACLVAAGAGSFLAYREC